MEIKRGGTQASQKPPAEHFTGTVRLDPLFQPGATQRAMGAYVTFEPCARTDWHTHPMGQILIVWLEKVTDEQYGVTKGASHAET